MLDGVAGPKEKLNSTVISQPAIYVASLAALEKLRQDEGDVSRRSPSKKMHLNSLLLCGGGLCWVHLQLIGLEVIRSFSFAGSCGCRRCGVRSEPGRIYCTDICQGNQVTRLHSESKIKSHQ
jgi:hypothetical protein